MLSNLLMEKQNQEASLFPSQSPTELVLIIHFLLILSMLLIVTFQLFALVVLLKYISVYHTPSVSQ